jgi:hypothetical protein
MPRKNRQKNSHGRRRERMKPVRRWQREVRAIDLDERARRGIDPSGFPTADDLVEEVICLASPEAYRSLDVVIPGTREDLARRWIAARLDGLADTEELRADLAAQIAPSPDLHLFPYVDEGKLRYRSANPELDAITAVATKYVRGRGSVALTQ